MGIHIGPSCHAKAQLSISDPEQELRSQLEESNKKYHELKERFLVSEATVYSMANELKKHKNHENEESKIEIELLTPSMNHEGAKEDKGEAILHASLLGDPKTSSQGCDEWNILEPLGDLIDDDELYFSLGETYPQEAGNEEKEAEHVVLR
ncbi:putative neuroblastoma breakpoint family member 5 [Octodon degus]|uniref:Neuroblastoma breakpoint family member 5 n=1 Tax=Octodon degus TaxID=10160 RepID=A0A6P6DXJ0_OCTDE|nr:putative neuroblastoma breakpoint family member 5 [Octodon degus]